MPYLSTLSSTQSPLSPHNPDSLTGTGDFGNGEVSGGEIRVLGVEIGDMSGGGVGEESVVGNGGEEYLKRCGRSGHGLELGLSAFGRSLSFLVSAPKAVSCRTCSLVIDPGDEVSCRVRGCPGVYHKLCARERFGSIIPKKFKCPQHVWHAFCANRSPFGDALGVSWLHMINALLGPIKSFILMVVLDGLFAGGIQKIGDWRRSCMTGLVHVLVNQLEAASSNIEEIFSCLPLPYIEEEFAIDSTWKSDHKNGKIGVRACFTISLLLLEFKEIFSRLPLPCMEEEFTIDSMLKSDEKNRKIEEIFDNLPLPYVLEEFKIDSSLKASGN
ncbi:Histone-lysine N-methyltransferase ASHR3-like protein, partial [Drosera capensis]